MIPQAAWAPPGQDISARRSPIAVGLWLGYRLAAAALVSAVLAAAIGARLGAVGDARVFEDGALYLAEIVRHVRPYLRFGASALTLALVIAAWLELLPLAGVLVSLRAARRAPARDAIRAAMRPFAALSLLYGVACVFQVLLGGAVGWAGFSIARTLPEGPTRDGARVLSVALTIVAACAVGVVHDAARVRAASGPVGVWSAITGGVRLVRRDLGVLAAGYVWRTASGVAGFALAAAAATSVGLETTAELVASTLLHALALASLVVARASWLALLTRRDVAG